MHYAWLLMTVANAKRCEAQTQKEEKKKKKKE
jgi:hypothetical protein